MRLLHRTSSPAIIRRVPTQNEPDFQRKHPDGAAGRRARVRSGSASVPETVSEVVASSFSPLARFSWKSTVGRCDSQNVNASQGNRIHQNKHLRRLSTPAFVRTFSIDIHPALRRLMGGFLFLGFP